MKAADKRRWKDYRWQVATTLMTKYKMSGELAAPVATMESVAGNVFTQLFEQGAMFQEVAGLTLQQGMEFMLSMAPVRYETKPTTEGK